MLLANSAGFRPPIECIAIELIRLVVCPNSRRPFLLIKYFSVSKQQVVYVVRLPGILHVSLVLLDRVLDVGGMVAEGRAWDCTVDGVGKLVHLLIMLNLYYY